jgi:hypothetical protein
LLLRRALIRSRIERGLAALGLASLTVAAIGIAARSPIPLLCSLGAFAIGLCIRRQNGAAASDYLQIARIVLLAGGAMIAVFGLFFSGAVWHAVRSLLSVFS